MTNLREGTMNAFDTIIISGRVVDGTGSPAFYADVGISDGRVAAVGNLSNCKAHEVIDACGKIVAPGHVNQHSHYDVALFWDPYCSNAGENGVTTVEYAVMLVLVAIAVLAFGKGIANSVTGVFSTLASSLK